MEKISEDEYLKTPIKGRGRSSHAFNAMFNLQPNEILKINRKDWHRRQGPSSVAGYIARKYNRRFQCSSLLDGTGWFVKRVE